MQLASEVLTVASVRMYVVTAPYRTPRTAFSVRPDFPPLKRPTAGT